MTAPIGAVVAASAAAGTALTLATTQPVSATEGVVLIVRSYPGSSGAVAQPASVAGFQHLGGVQNTNSSFVVRIDAYYARGAGSVINVNVPATASVIRNGSLQRFDAIDRDDFVTAAPFVALTTNRTDASVNIPASDYANAYALAAVAVGGTFGGTGPSWNAGSPINAGSGTAVYSIQGLTKPTPGIQTLTATWTTSGTASILGLLVGGDAATPLATPSPTLVSTTDPTTVGGTDGKAVISWPAVPNAVAYRVELAPGANVNVGFVVKSENATSPYTVTGLADGTYTIAVTAKPSGT